MKACLKFGSRFAVAATIAAALSACWLAPIAPIRPLPPFVIDSSVRSLDRDIFWIDDKRVVFSAASPNDIALGSENRVVIWDIDTGDVEYISQVAPWSICYSAITGHLAYSYQNPDGEGASWINGPLGHQKNLRENDLPTRPVLNKFTCRWESLPEWLWDNRHDVVALVPDDGYLVNGRPGNAGSQEVLYYAAESRAGVPIPMSELAINGDCLRHFQTSGYYPSMRAYFIFSCRNASGLVRNCRPGWWFWPRELRAEKFCLPDATANLFNLPTRLGLVTDRHNIDNGSIQDSGLFLFRNGRRIRIFKGAIQSLAVSPNGCKIAFASAPNFLSHLGASPYYRKLRTMKAIDLCASEIGILSHYE